MKKDFEFTLDGSASEALVNDIKKALLNNRYEINDQGLLVIGNNVGVELGGVFECHVDRDPRVSRAMESGDLAEEMAARELVAMKGGYKDSLMHSVDHNLMPDAGINYVLNVLFYTTSKIATWYQGPFKSDWTPVAGALSNWAGAGSGPLATELTDAEYDESGRQAMTFGTAASAKAISTTTASTFTIASGVSSLSLYGSTVNSIATVAYNSTDQILAAATRFSSTKTGLGATDVVNISYSLSGASR